MAPEEGFASGTNHFIAISSSYISMNAVISCLKIKYIPTTNTS